MCQFPKHLKHLMSQDLLGCWGSVTFSFPFKESELVFPLVNSTFSSRLGVLHVRVEKQPLLCLT
jgi:hypothetical protein